MAKKLAPNYVGIDPMTGLPVSAPQKELNLSTELADFTRTGRLSTPQVPSFATTPIDATSLEDFQELPKFAGWSQGEAEDVRAEAQSWYSSLGNGIARLGLTTGTKLLSGVSSVGDVIMNSAASLALDEDVSGATPLSGLFDSMEEAIKEAFPVYNTRADQRKNFLHRAVTDLDFWTNDMVDGAAFMISAYLTGMGAAKLLGPATKALYGARLEAAAATEAAKIAELESAIAAGNQAAKAELIGTSLVKGNLAKTSKNELLDQVEEVNGINFLAAELSDIEAPQLRNMIDELKNKLKSAVILLASIKNKKITLAIGITSNLLEKFNANEFAKIIGPVIAGNGGGKPDMAMVGGSDPKGLKIAFESIRKLL